MTDTIDEPDLGPDDEVYISDRAMPNMEVHHVNEHCSTRRGEWAETVHVRDLPKYSRACTHCAGTHERGSHTGQYNNIANRLRRGDLTPEDLGFEPLETPDPGPRVANYE